MPEIAQIVLREMEPGFCLIDDRGQVSLINRTGRDMLGRDLTDEDLLAMDLDDQPALIAETVECYRRQRETGGCAKHLLVFTREDRLRCLSLSIFPVEADGLTATGMMLDDVSRALTEAPGLNKILSVVRHDLRSPLTSITGASELLLSERLGAVSGNQARLLKIIEEGASRLGELIEKRTRVPEELTQAGTGEIS